MITDKRLKWLNDNKKRGEIASVVKLLNPKKSKAGITYAEAGSIMAGNLWGKHGKEFTDKMEEVIKARLRNEAIEVKKYSTAVN